MIDKLIQQIVEKKNPTVLGLDPMLEYLPDTLIEKHCRNGINLETAANAIFEFNKRIIDAVHELIPAVKIQIAYYEMYGPAGLEVFKATSEYARERGMIIIGDVKRNDIGSTAKAYSSAYLGETQLKEYSAKAFDMDFITVNPYFGFDGIQPFIEDCSKFGKGIFILVRTSNSSAGEIQDLQTDQGKIYQIVARKVCQWGKGLRGKMGYSYVGAVIGATYPEQLKELRKTTDKTYFLVPGYGAQGGRVEDILGCFNEDGLGAVINASRSIICAYRRYPWNREFGSDEFDKAARKEAMKMRDEINAGMWSKGICPW